MRLRDRRNLTTPDVMIIPMIDIMFFLLVFFMLSSMYMTDLKTIPVKLPKAVNAAAEGHVTLAVTLKEDGALYLNEEQLDRNSLLMRIADERRQSADVAVAIRAEQNVEYGKVISLIDDLKGQGITRFGMAAEGGGR